MVIQPLFLKQLLFYDFADEGILRGHVMDYNIKLSAIAMPETTGAYLPFYDKISEVMNGKAHVVHNDGNIMDFYVSLNEAFADVLHSEALYPTEIPELVHKEAFVGETGVSSGNFLIDSTLGRDTLFGIYVEDEEDHLIKSIRFTDSKGKTYGPFHRMSSDFDLVNFKTINFPAGQSPPFSAVSTFSILNVCECVYMNVIQFKVSCFECGLLRIRERKFVG